MIAKHHTFRTTLVMPAFPFHLHHADQLVCMGSCFAEHIGSRLQSGKFQVELNPFGILYNPVSIAQALGFLADQRQYAPEDLFLHNECWHSFDHHGAFSGLDAEETAFHINERVRQGGLALRYASTLIITLGSAHVFVLKSNSRIVANCHKLPGSDFDRRRLSVEETVAALSKAIERARQLNPALRIILTVSPVRHIRDGLVENQRSKATLLLAAADLCSSLPEVYYFPAYELLTDDLRDYRFYESDLIHPNDMAIDYIWQYFHDACFDENTQYLLRRIHAITSAARHRPFFTQTKAHQDFVRRQLDAITELNDEYPHLDFSEERRLFSLSVQ
ncbi:MAG: GSCFA domain-containing protein [Saprospiraceae bacterium]|nr:GSCFA domain-containing protein [Saprospiraceae bacterium]